MSRLPGSIDQRKKDAVLEVAAALVVARGPDASLRLIAKRSGVAKQTIYNYFGDKPGLFQALLDSRARPTECPTCVYPMEGAPAPFLSAYAKVLLEWLRRMRLAAGLRAVILPERAEVTYRDPGLGDAAAGPPMHALARVLAEAARRGQLRIDDPEEAATLFLNLVTAGRSCGGFHAGLEAELTADAETAADACGRVFAQAYTTAPNDLDEDVIANRTAAAAGRVSIGHPIHPREEASP
jgi:AcrR family transcriptional regulator